MQRVALLVAWEGIVGILARTELERPGRPRNRTWAQHGYPLPFRSGEVWNPSALFLVATHT